jgi:hypothetical protein
MTLDNGPGSDGRAERRRQIRRPIQVMTESTTVMYAMTTDVSTTGVGMTVQYPLSVGKTYNFAFDVTIGDQKRQIQFVGVVAHCDALPGQGYRTGIRITEIQGASVQSFNDLFDNSGA